MIILRNSYQKLGNVEHWHVGYHPKMALQRYSLSKIIIYVYFCRPIKNKMLHNTSFLPQFQWKKCLSWLSLVWWMFRKNISKMKNVDFVSYFFTTQNQFYCKEPHSVVLGHIYCPNKVVYPSHYLSSMCSYWIAKVWFKYYGLLEVD